MGTSLEVQWLRFHTSTAGYVSLISSVYVTKWCPTSRVYYSTPGFLVHHQLLELTQTHVHPVSHAI